MPAKQTTAEAEPTTDTATAQPTPAGSVDAAIVALMMQQIAELKQKLDAQEAARRPTDFGPPAPPRKSLKRIPVFVNAHNSVMVEVTDDYIEQKQPGWDGRPVKGYQNHRNTLLVK